MGRLGQNTLLLDPTTSIKRLFGAGGREVPIVNNVYANLTDVSVISFITDGNGCEVFDGSTKKVFNGSTTNSILSKLSSAGIISVPLMLDKKGFSQYLFCYPVSFDTASFISSL